MDFLESAEFTTIYVHIFLKVEPWERNWRDHPGNKVSTVFGQLWVWLLKDLMSKIGARLPRAKEIEVQLPCPGVTSSTRMYL